MTAGIDRIPASLTAAEAAERQWDVAVIGAGPAGSLAARQLAQSGLSVLLIDKRGFPRDKVCGACFNDRCARVLQSVGLGRLFADLGAVPLNRICLASGTRRLEVNLPGSWALSRDRFDAALVRAAMASGVAFLPEVTATVLDHSHSDVRFLRLVQGGHNRVVAAKVLVAADGLGSPSTAKTNEFAATVRNRSRIGLGATFDSLRTDLSVGAIHMTAASSGYVGVVRMDDGKLHFAAAVDPSFVRRQANPHQAVGALLGNPRWWSNAEAPIWHGTPQLTRTVRRPVSWRIFLLGDAAGYVEPFTGEGIAWALAGAAAVESFARRGVERWDNRLEEEWLQHYHSQIRARQKWCRAFSYVLRHPTLTRSALVGFQRVPRFADALAKQILAT